MIFKNKFLDYLNENSTLESEPIKSLAGDWNLVLLFIKVILNQWIPTENT